MNRAKYLLLSLLLVSSLTRFTVSQTSSTSLQGTVSDSTGSAIAGASVTLVNTESRLERTVPTGAQGEYRFLALPPGKYTLAVTSKGFARYEQTDLQLLVNTPATTNVQLKIGASTESITVSSEASIMNLVDASLGNSFGETQVKEIPLEGRNVPDLLTLQAGVASRYGQPELQGSGHT